MEVFPDGFGYEVRLPAERLAHIAEPPEMVGMIQRLGSLLLRPDLVRLSRTDPSVRVFYEFQKQSSVEGKWLCAVVKYFNKDACVITSYLTDKPKLGADLWPIN